MSGAPAAAVVSGASTGIGFAAAALLARRGYITFAGVRNEADARRLEAEHPNLRAVMLDVCDGASIAAAFGAVAASGIPLKAVVSNAGIALGGPLEHVAIDDLRRQLEVNVVGALALVQAALPLLGPGGRIVFVGSISGRLAIPYIGPYSASKFALRALADALRVELAPGRIAVSLIEPGSVATPIWSKGRAARERILAGLAATPRAYYRDVMSRVLAQTQTEERSGMPAERVARAIAHAVASPRPRPNYVLGAPARAGSLLALLPAAWRDRAARAAMRLP
ncbi:MAG TPA: SDR family NAD(P)-dependent oxidoreductase [Candidatus Tumulicola sp.]|nr:SDR family NAD(P)-dependent oxidoreductase [Candidatus Tumulicola sp.]